KLLELGLLRWGRWLVDTRVDRRAVGLRDLGVVLSRILAGTRGDLGCQQSQDDAVLVRGPSAAVHAKEAGTGAFFAAKAKAAVLKAADEPLEAHGYLAQIAAERGGNPVDDGARHQRLADRGSLGPLRPVAEQVANGDGEIMVGIEQPSARNYDPVPIRIGVVAERHLVLAAQIDELGHGVGAGAIHADFPVVVDGHKSELGIDGGV